MESVIKQEVPVRTPEQTRYISVRLLARLCCLHIHNIINYFDKISFKHPLSEFTLSMYLFVVFVCIIRISCCVLCLHVSEFCNSL